VRRNVNSPHSADAHTFNTVLEACNYASLAYSKSCDLPALKSIAAIEKPCVPDLNGCAALGYRTVANHEVFDLNSAAQAHSKIITQHSALSTGDLAILLTNRLWLRISVR
jgi:hypothetical protein